MKYLFPQNLLLNSCLQVIRSLLDFTYEDTNKLKKYLEQIFLLHLN